MPKSPVRQTRPAGIETKTLYHVTPDKNRGSIAVHGIEPILATGKQKLSWFVDKSRLVWALAHCSARHNVPVSDLVVFEIPAHHIPNIRRTAWKGVYSTPCHSRPINYRKGEEYVREPS